MGKYVIFNFTNSRVSLNKSGSPINQAICDFSFHGELNVYSVNRVCLFSG